MWGSDEACIQVKCSVNNHCHSREESERDEKTTPAEARRKSQSMKRPAPPEKTGEKPSTDPAFIWTSEWVYLEVVWTYLHLITFGKILGLAFWTSDVHAQWLLENWSAHEIAWHSLLRWWARAAETCMATLICWHLVSAHQASSVLSCGGTGIVWIAFC